MSTEPEPRPERGLAAPVWTVALHAALLAGLFVMYVGYVGAAKKLFDDYRMMLPKLSQFVTRLSLAVADYWWALVPGAVAALAADFAVALALRRLGAAHALLWAATIAVLLGAFALLTVYAVEHPKQMLREALAR